jgi:thiol-disulfide isomerase/thioredoxin
MGFSDVRINGSGTASWRMLMVMLVAGLAVLPRAAQAQAPQTPPAGAARAKTPQTQPAGAEGKAPKFRCDETTRDFGTVWSGDEVKVEFIVHNNGDAPLDLTRVRPSCGCTKAEEFDKIIPPGGKVSMKFKVRTNSMRGQVTKVVQVWCNDQTVSQPIKLYIKGTIKARIALEPRNGANFGSKTPEDDLVKTVTLTNNTEKPMKLQIKPNQRESIFSYELKELEPGKKAELTVRANPPFKTRANSFRIAVLTGIPEEPQITVPCYLYAKPMVEVQPNYQSLTVPLAKEWKQNNIQIKNHGKVPMKIASVDASHPEIKSELTEVTPGKIYRLSTTMPAGFDPPANEPVKIAISTNVKDYEEVLVHFRTRRASPSQRSRLLADQLVGKKAPPVAITSAEGGSLRLGAMNNKVTVLNFFMSTCGWCKKQIPDVQAVADTYRAKGVDFLMVSADTRRSKDDILKTVKDLKSDLPIALDGKRVAAGAYGVRGYPTLFLLNKDGTIEAVHRGAKKTLKDNLKAQLDVLLAGKNRTAFAGAKSPPPKQPATRPAPALTDTPKLAFASKRIDTGQHKPAQTVSQKITYRNEGGQPLTVQAISGSTGLTVKPGYTKTVAPGQSGQVEVSFETPGRAQSLSHTLTFASNDPRQGKHIVELTGLTRPWIDVEPIEGVDFGRKVPTFSMPRLATLVYNGTEPIKYLKTASTSKKFSGEVKLIQKGPNAMVIVKAHPPFDPGENQALITITTDCKQQPEAVLPVRLFLPPRIEVTPPVVEVARQSRLQKIEVKIANNSTSPMHILGVERSSNTILTQFFPEPDGMSYKLVMTFRKNFVCAPGGEKITIRTDDADYGEIVIPIKMKGTVKHVSTSK